MAKRINYDVTVRAGVGGESSDTFHYVSSRMPHGVKSVDEQPYSAICQAALNAAKAVVRQTGKNLTLKLKVTLK